MESRRLYSLGDAIDALMQEALELWRVRHGGGKSAQQAKDQRLGFLEVSIRDDRQGTVWIYVYCYGKQKRWNDDRAWKLMKYSSDLYYFAYYEELGV